MRWEEEEEDVIGVSIFIFYPTGVCPEVKKKMISQPKGHSVSSTQLEEEKRVLLSFTFTSVIVINIHRNRYHKERDPHYVIQFILAPIYLTKLVA